MGYSILMVASHMGYVEVVKMLVAAGADPHAAHKKVRLHIQVLLVLFEPNFQAD